MRLSFILNGRRIICDVRDNQTLLDLLRNDLGVTSVKKGCEQGECGVCTVLLDGEPVTSCLVLARMIEEREITTVEGLATDPKMKALREAFLEEGAVQCGYCTPGMLLSAYALIRSNSNPTADQVKEAIEGNLCRCTGYVKIIEAILQAAKRIET